MNETPIKLSPIADVTVILPKSATTRATPPSKYAELIEQALTLKNGQAFSVFTPPDTKGDDFQRNISGVLRRFVSPSFKEIHKGTLGLSVRQVKDSNKNVVAVAIVCGAVKVRKARTVATPGADVATAKPATETAPAPTPAPANTGKKTGVATAKA